MELPQPREPARPSLAPDSSPLECVCVLDVLTPTSSRAVVKKVKKVDSYCLISSPVCSGLATDYGVQYVITKKAGSTRPRLDGFCSRESVPSM